MSSVAIRRQFGTTTLHANIGGVFDREADTGTRRYRLTWALAAEHLASGRWTFAGEVFGLRGKPETMQVGQRWWTLPKNIQYTSSIAAQCGAGQDGCWVSFGIRFETGGSIF